MVCQSQGKTTYIREHDTDGPRPVLSVRIGGQDPWTEGSEVTDGGRQPGQAIYRLIEAY